MTAKVSSINKTRKERPCSKCGKVLPVGSSVYVWSFFYGNSSQEHTQCMECGYPKRCQLVQNEDLSSIYAVEDDFLKEVGEANDSSAFTAAVENARSGADDVISNLEEKISNMESNNLGDSDPCQLLQERRDAIEEWIDELESVTIPDDVEGEDEEGEELETAKEELQNISLGI